MHTARLFELRDKVAVITGGSTGLGRQIAGALADMGANVVLAARNLERCQLAAHELAESGVQTIAVGCDVTKPDQVQQLVDRVNAEFGHIDILVNNAGMTWGGRPEVLALEDWNKVIAVNVTGTFLCSQLLGRVMIRQKYGKIINMASIEGLVGVARVILWKLSFTTQAKERSLILPGTWPVSGLSIILPSMLWHRGGFQPT